MDLAKAVFQKAGPSAAATAGKVLNYLPKAFNNSASPCALLSGSAKTGAFMNWDARSVAIFSGAGAVAVLAAYVLAAAPHWIHLLREGGPVSADTALLVFGTAILLSGIWRFWALGGAWDLRWPIWMAMGAFVLYAEIFDVVPLKQMACRVFLTPHSPMK